MKSGVSSAIVQFLLCQFMEFNNKCIKICIADLDQGPQEDVDVPEVDQEATLVVAQPAGPAAGAGARLLPLAAAPGHLNRMEQMHQIELVCQIAVHFLGAVAHQLLSAKKVLVRAVVKLNISKATEHFFFFIL